MKLGHVKYNDGSALNNSGVSMKPYFHADPVCDCGFEDIYPTMIFCPKCGRHIDHDFKGVYLDMEEIKPFLDWFANQKREKLAAKEVAE